MKPRHTAALALTAWYMITPPITYDMKAGERINFKAPPTEWTIIEEFDSKEDCTKALVYRELLAEQAGSSASDKAQQTRLWREAFSRAQCIAEKDLLRNGGFIGKIR